MANTDEYSVIEESTFTDSAANRALAPLRNQVTDAAELEEARLGSLELEVLALRRQLPRLLDAEGKDITGLLLLVYEELDRKSKRIEQLEVELDEEHRGRGLLRQRLVESERTRAEEGARHNADLAQLQEYITKQEGERAAQLYEASMADIQEECLEHIQDVEAENRQMMTDLANAAAEKERLIADHEAKVRVLLADNRDLSARLARTEELVGHLQNAAAVASSVPAPSPPASGENTPTRRSTPDELLSELYRVLDRLDANWRKRESLNNALTDLIGSTGDRGSSEAINYLGDMSAKRAEMTRQLAELAMSPEPEVSPATIAILMGDIVQAFDAIQDVTGVLEKVLLDESDSAEGKYGRLIEDIKSFNVFMRSKFDRITDVIGGGTSLPLEQTQPPPSTYLDAVEQAAQMDTLKEALRDEISRKENLVRNYEDNIAFLQRRCSEFSNQITSMTVDAQNVKAEHGRMLKEHAERCAQVQGDLQLARDELATREAEVLQLRERLAQVEKQAREPWQSNAELRDENGHQSQFDAHIRSLNERCEGMSRELKMKEEEHEALQAELQDACKTAEEYQRKSLTIELMRQQTTQYCVAYKEYIEQIATRLLDPAADPLHRPELIPVAIHDCIMDFVNRDWPRCLAQLSGTSSVLGSFSARSDFSAPIDENEKHKAIKSIKDVIDRLRMAETDINHTVQLLKKLQQKTEDVNITSLINSCRRARNSVHQLLKCFLERKEAVVNADNLSSVMQGLTKIYDFLNHSKASGFQSANVSWQ